MAKKKTTSKSSKTTKPEIRPRAIADGVNVWCSHSEISKIGALVPNPENPNRHPVAQVELLAKIIVGQGWRNAIVISTRSGFITKGHGRLAAAKHAGLSEVPVDFQDYDTEAAEWADLVADNRIAELADMDPKGVYDILDAHIPDEYDSDLTGYDEAAIADLLKYITDEPPPIPPADDTTHTSGDGDPCPYCGQTMKSTEKK